MSRDDKFRQFEKMMERERDSWRIRRKDANDRKTYDEVFNKENLLRVYKLFSDGVMDQLDFPISTGKEGNVFRASTVDGTHLAVKIYRTSTATFRDMGKYIMGDPRFKGMTSNRRKLVLAWAAKEYRNLQRLHEAGVRVPKAVAIYKNVVVMEYIGTEEAPALEMRNSRLNDPGKIARTLLDYVRTAYREAELVHGDLSEFNVLMLDDEPVVIDVGQAVLLEHPLAQEFLERDLANMARYFRKHGIVIDVAKELEEIRKE